MAFALVLSLQTTPSAFAFADSDPVSHSFVMAVLVLELSISPSKPWAIAQAICSKSANFGTLAISAEIRTNNIDLDQDLTKKLNTWSDTYWQGSSLSQPKLCTRKASLHSRWNFSSTFIESHGHSDQRKWRQIHICAVSRPTDRKWPTDPTWAAGKSSDSS